MQVRFDTVAAKCLNFVTVSRDLLAVVILSSILMARQNRILCCFCVYFWTNLPSSL